MHIVVKKRIDGTPDCTRWRAGKDTASRKKKFPKKLCKKKFPKTLCKHSLNPVNTCRRLHAGFGTATAA